MLLENVPSNSDSLHQWYGHYNPLIILSIGAASRYQDTRAQPWNIPP
ncbi:hypothetical protein SACS_0257 [Parasaccharibacter apium]|uniref:Uncharacterized protein n=1 Tax=Parasaccharibacter apium TaxID=1510841 RepID=A0A7U7G4H9_9PROT|nr:hypothetical protein SACS_0257 [Parasaccharibacter apium]